MVLREREIEREIYTGNHSWRNEDRQRRIMPHVDRKSWRKQNYLRVYKPDLRFAILLYI